MRRFLPNMMIFAWIWVFVCACGGDSASVDNNLGPDSSHQPDMGNDLPVAPPDAAPDMVEMGPLPQSDRTCDPLDEGACALPWPSNLYLHDDPSRETGYSVTFQWDTLPRNRLDALMNPEPFRRMDGYGLGTSIMALFPHVDVTGLPDQYDLGPSMEADANILLYEVSPAGGLERVPYFVDLDHYAAPNRKVLIVRPAVILKEDTRYVVAFRSLRDEDGELFERSPAFEKLLEGDTERDPDLHPRQARFDEVFSLLSTAGIEPGELQLAWDFHTASSSALHGRMLHIRDEALAAYPQGPALRIASVQEFTPQQNQLIAYEFVAELDVPSYVEPDEDPDFDGLRLRLNQDGQPIAEGTRTVEFWIRVPRSATDGTPHGLLKYGHGLLGSGTQVRGGFNSRIANDHHFILYGASLSGMSSREGGMMLDLVQDLNRFYNIGDVLHQGLLEWILITRAMKEQFKDLAEVVLRDIVVDETELYYSGISQGGIFGSTFVALSPDVSLGHLGVPGHNYSVLLHRSIDFSPFFAVLMTAYRDFIDQQILVSAVQLQWDATDPVSYMHRLSEDPFPGHGPQYVLLAPAKGDWQVDVQRNEVVARSQIGVALMEHYDRERTRIEFIEQTPYPHTGSGVVLWDFSNPWPAAGNVPPSDAFGDPHGIPRNRQDHNSQMVHFFRSGGEIIDVCNMQPCYFPRDPN